MCENEDVPNNYPFFWLDQIVEITLNPTKVESQNLTDASLAAIREKLPEEINRITACLKRQAFCLYSGEHLKAVAGHYDQAVRLLQKQARENLDRYAKDSSLYQTGQFILNTLNELFGCLYRRYPNYLSEPQINESDKTAIAYIDKILCTLSADQLGVFLRAANDADLLPDQSFRKLCKAVAPFLSTPWKEEIAADTLRSHGSRPESRDRTVVIELLEKMIEKIRGYR